MIDERDGTRWVKLACLECGDPVYREDQELCATCITADVVVDDEGEPEELNFDED